MVEKLKDAAKLLKAKITLDDLEVKLMEVTSEENWQASTKQLHQISNIAYNYDKWEKISKFIWEKLRKSKSWKTLLKTLNLVEFLIKNGPPNCIGAFKYEIYQFKSFQTFSHQENGVQRGQTIRERAKAITDLLSKEELLEEERVKAKNIKDKMSAMLADGSSSQMSYGGQAGDNTQSRKYESYDSSNFGTLMPTPKYEANSLGIYGDYGTTTSTLSKYKDSSKQTTNTTQNKEEGIEGQKKSQIKKPFQKEVQKLVKPGANNENREKQGNDKTKENQKKQLSEDFFLILEPKETEIKNQTVKPKYIDPPAPQNNFTKENYNPTNQYPNYSNQQIPTNYELSNQFNQLNSYGTQNIQLYGVQNNQQFQPQINQFAQINQQFALQNPQYGGIPNQQHPGQINQQYGQINQQYGQINQQYSPINQQYAQINQHPGQMNQQSFNQFGQNPQINPYNVIPYNQNPNMYNDQQNSPNKVSYPGSYPIQPFSNIIHNPLKQVCSNTKNQISLSSGKSCQPVIKKEQQQFGYFESANTSKVNWLTSKEKNLTDFSDFGIEMKNQPVKAEKSREINNDIKIDMWNW